MNGFCLRLNSRWLQVARLSPMIRFEYILLRNDYDTRDHGG